MTELPKTFHSAKREFEKMFNFSVANAKNDDKKVELENYAVLFALIQEFNSFLAKYEEIVSVGVKERMDELGKKKVFLQNYDRKLEWDSEAQWLYLSEMSQSDKIELTKLQNAEFLKKRMAEKNYEFNE